MHVTKAEVVGKWVILLKDVNSFICGHWGSNMVPSGRQSNTQALDYTGPLRMYGIHAC